MGYCFEFMNYVNMKYRAELPQFEGESRAQTQQGRACLN